MAIMFRYHFFLQLKMDVIEGRILCDADQAVLLASYSMQGSKNRHYSHTIKNLIYTIEFIHFFF